jgi:DNA-binding NarL/FixJ family response regulator
MFAKVLVAPLDSLEADCAAVALDAAGLGITAVPEPDVDAVLLFATPGGVPGTVGEIFGDDRVRPLLLVAAGDDASVADLARRLGAAGVVDWTAPTSVLVESLRRMARGETWGCEPAAEGAADPLRRLTGRELDVVRLLGEGATNESISQALGISYHTVRTHVAHVLAKLGVSHRYAVVGLLRGSDRATPVPSGGGGP